MDVYLLAFIGYVLGAILRTCYDIMFKWLEDPNLVFDKKYIVTMLISIILSIISATITFAGVIIPEGSEATVLILTISTGFMVNHLVNKPVAALAKAKETPP